MRSVRRHASAPAAYLRSLPAHFPLTSLLTACFAAAVSSPPHARSPWALIHHTNLIGRTDSQREDAGNDSFGGTTAFRRELALSGGRMEQDGDGRNDICVEETGAGQGCMKQGGGEQAGGQEGPSAASHASCSDLSVLTIHLLPLLSLTTSLPYHNLQPLPSLLEPWRVGVGIGAVLQNTLTAWAHVPAAYCCPSCTLSQRLAHLIYQARYNPGLRKNGRQT